MPELAADAFVVLVVMVMAVLIVMIVIVPRGLRAHAASG
jgi:hypothetical protein